MRVTLSRPTRGRGFALSAALGLALLFAGTAPAHASADGCNDSWSWFDGNPEVCVHVTGDSTHVTAVDADASDPRFPGICNGVIEFRYKTNDNDGNLHIVQRDRLAVSATGPVGGCTSEVKATSSTPGSSGYSFPDSGGRVCAVFITHDSDQAEACIDISKD
ncbi:MAG: hypothetical protein ACK5MT_02760 [Actinomycetales bacterium]